LKKLISAMLMLVLTIGMFAGVSFASSDLYVVLNNNKIVQTNQGSLIEIRGRVVDGNGYTYQNDIVVELISGSEVYRTATYRNGSFTITAIDNMLEVGDYSVRPVGHNYDEPDGKNKLRVVPDVRLASDSTLNYSFPVSDDLYISGFFPNEDGNQYTYTFGYVNSNNKLESTVGTVVARERTFAILVDRNDLGKTGKIGIFADGVLALEGELKAGELDVSMNPTSVVHTIDGDQTLTFNFNLPSDYFSNNELKSNYRFRIDMENTNSGESSISDRQLTVSGGRSDLKGITSIDFRDWSSGRTDVIVKLIDLDNFSNIVKQKSLTLNVTRPDAYTLMGWGLDKRTAGTIKFALPDIRYTTVAVYPDENSADQKIHVKDRQSNDMIYFEVVAKGAGVDTTFRNFGTNASTSATVNPTQTGNLDLTIKVFSSETSTSPVRIFNQRIQVTGFNVRVEPKEIQVDSKRDVVVTVTDENNNAINNAIVRFNNTTVVSGYSQNIQNGRYVYRDDEKSLFNSVRSIDVEVIGIHHGDELTIKLSNEIQVVGERVFNVTSNVDSIVNGIRENVYITTREGSTNISPDKIELIYVDKDGNKSAPEAYTGSRTYSDGAVRISIRGENNHSAIIVRTSTNNGKKMGEVSINVTGAEVEMKASETATENIRSTFKFVVLDPRDNEPLEKYVYFVADRNYIDYTVRHDGQTLSVNSDGRSSARLPNVYDEYEFEVLVNDVDWDKAEDDDQELMISVYAEEDGNDIMLFDIPVGQAQIVTNPSEIIVGAPATQVKLTYMDADGKVLSGYEILVNDDSIGSTDSNGEIYFSTASSLGMAVNIKAKTDDTKADDSDILNPSSNNEDTIYTLHRIRPVADTKPPVASAPATVNTNSVLISIKDEGRVSQARINGTPVDIFFPVAEVTHFVRDLKVGENRIVVEAVDVAGNYSTTDLVVTYQTGSTTPEPPAGEVTFTIGKASPYGTPLLRDGTTMVPVRFAESLGATFEWDNIAKKATYKLGDRTIEVTIGAEFAKVNGVNVLMTEKAYLNDQGRTMVPVRLIAQELGFVVNWTSNTAPISIVPAS